MCSNPVPTLFQAGPFETWNTQPLLLWIVGVVFKRVPGVPGCFAYFSIFPRPRPVAARRSACWDFNFMKNAWNTWNTKNPPRNLAVHNPFRVPGFKRTRLERGWNMPGTHTYA